MYSSITRLSMSQLEDRWSTRIREEYQGLDDCEDIIGFLKSPVYSITFRYALCRFLRRQYGTQNPDGSWTIMLDDFCADVSGGADAPLKEDVESYITLMLMLAEKRGMKGAFQGKHLRLYLLGKQAHVSRDTLFRMAFAFDMDCEAVCELLESMDEIPYNFRRAEECICYYCQYSGDYNTWDAYQEMLEEYQQYPVPEASEELSAGQSRLMQDNIENILLQDLSPEASKKAFMDSMRSAKGLLTGFSQSAYEELDALLEELTDITGARDDTELTIRLWEPVWYQFYTKKGDATGVNRSDFVPWKDLLDLPKTVFEKPLWRARVQKLRARKVPVEKRDILFLNCMRWANDVDTQGGREAMQEFIAETNDILLRSGLAAVYPPNPYDRMILLAVCSSSPYDVLSDIFNAATDEEKLEERLLEGACG